MILQFRVSKHTRALVGRNRICDYCHCPILKPGYPQASNSATSNQHGA